QQSLFTIRIDPDHSQQLRFSDLVDTYEYLPLETTTESQIGKVTKIKFSKDLILLSDIFSANTLSVFDRDGTYQFKVGQKGRGPGEYEFLLDFSLDEQKKEILLLDNGYFVISYDFSGKYLAEKAISGYSALYMEKTPEGYAFIGGNEYDNLILADNQLQKINSFFPFQNADIEATIIHPLQYIDAHTVIYRRNLYDTIFSVKEDHIEPHLRIDFGSKTLTYPELMDKNVSHVWEYVRDYPVVSSYYETPDHAYLTLGYQGRGKHALYCKTSGNLRVFDFTDLENDITFEKKSKLMGVDIYTRSFVYLVQPYVLKQALAAEGLPADSPHFQKIHTLASSLDELSNPILMFVKFKEF
ncbi:MAG: 6-bladed beta-propeller, partial [Bacteroidetes bacterium]